jgi:hypothetical protein
VLLHVGQCAGCPEVAKKSQDTKVLRQAGELGLAGSRGLLARESQVSIPCRWLHVVYAAAAVQVWHLDVARAFYAVGPAGQCVYLDPLLMCFCHVHLGAWGVVSQRGKCLSDCSPLVSRLSPTLQQFSRHTYVLVGVGLSFALELMLQRNHSNARLSSLG